MQTAKVNVRCHLSSGQTPLDQFPPTVADRQQAVVTDDLVLVGWTYGHVALQFRRVLFSVQVVNVDGREHLGGTDARG